MPPSVASNRYIEALRRRAYLAAYATAAGYQLMTTDIAFRQYRGLYLVVLNQEDATFTTKPA